MIALTDAIREAEEALAKCDGMSPMGQSLCAVIAAPLRSLLDAVKTESDSAHWGTVCDVCLGVPPSGGGWCACGGTGKLADTLHYVRTVLHTARETNENLYAQHAAMQERIITNDEERNDALTMALCWEVRYNEQKARADAAEKERDENEREYNEVLGELKAEVAAWKLNADPNETVATANLSRAISAEKQNETLRMLLIRVQEARDALQSELDTNERCSNEEINRLRDSLEGANRENERLRSHLRIAQTVSHSRRPR